MKFIQALQPLFLFQFCHQVLSVNDHEAIAYLQPQKKLFRLLVDRKPFFLLGRKSANSNASSFLKSKNAIDKLQQINLNTVLVPAYWELLEPGKSVFGFTLLYTFN